MVLYLYDNVPELRECVELLPDTLVCLLQVIGDVHIATPHLTQQGVKVAQVLVVQELVNFQRPPVVRQTLERRGVGVGVASGGGGLRQLRTSSQHCRPDSPLASGFRHLKCYTHPFTFIPSIHLERARFQYSTLK